MNRIVEKSLSTNRLTHSFLARLAVLLFWLSLSVSTLQAQTAAFNYQGRLTDGGGPATGVYDLQFKLFDALSGGNQVGSRIVLEDVSVTNGIFSVTLDFGATSFPGAERFLEIGVRPGVSTGSFTILSPLQAITSTPYAIKSLGAAAADGLSVACVNCVTSSQIGSLPSGSGNYIQNTATLQASSTFNISGNGLIGGNVGIGTLTPSAKLHVSGGGFLLDNNQGLFLKDNGGASKRVLLGDTSNILNIGSGGGAGFDEMRFALGTLGNIMFLKSTGELGIGTNSPGAKLHVSGGGFLLDNNHGLFLKDTGGAGKRVLLGDTSNILNIGGGAGVGFDEMRFALGTPGNVMTLKSTGEVGVGTTSPGARLHVSGGGLLLDNNQGLFLKDTITAIKRSNRQCRHRDDHPFDQAIRRR